jgi:hypothetical protein
MLIKKSRPGGRGLRSGHGPTIVGRDVRLGFFFFFAVGAVHDLVAQPSWN